MHTDSTSPPHLLRARSLFLQGYPWQDSALLNEDIQQAFSTPEIRSAETVKHADYTPTLAKEDWDMEAQYARPEHYLQVLALVSSLENTVANS